MYMIRLLHKKRMTLPIYPLILLKMQGVIKFTVNVKTENLLGQLFSGYRVVCHFTIFLVMGVFHWSRLVDNYNFFLRVGSNVYGGDLLGLSCW